MKKENKISFENYFAILRKKNKSILEHHSFPLKTFFKRFGKTDSQTKIWFDEHLKKYGNL